MVACSVANHKYQNTNQNRKHKARRRSPSQICVSPSKGQQSKQRTGQEPNRNNHKRFAKDTVVKTHCVATDSKPCNKRISCHPEQRDKRSTLLPRRQQKVAIAIHCRLTQPLRVLSRVLVHVPMFRKRASTKRCKQEQEEDDIGGQVSCAPPHCGERHSGYDKAVTQGQVSDHPSPATKKLVRLRVDMTTVPSQKGERSRHYQAWSAPSCCA